LEPPSYGDLATLGAETYALQPLFAEGVQSDVSLVSNLLMPWGNSGNLAPGGRVTELDFHFGPTVTPQLSGLKALQKGAMKGASSDQLLVEQLAPDTRFPSLIYRVQPVDYLGGNGGGAGRLSFRRDGGSIVPMDPIVSPQLAYENLFSSFEPPGVSAEALAAHQRRIDVLGHVGTATRDLLPTLGAADRIRLERHLHEVELLASQLQSNDSTGVSGACSMLDDPGSDPAIGGTHAGEGEIASGLGWSDEDRRARLHSDFIRMAFACDLSRVATLMYTNWKSWMSAEHIGQGWNMDIHQVGHTGAVPREAMGDVVAWHVGHFARLVRILEETPEWDGSSVLDHTVLVLCFEGGHGADALDGKPSVHSTENMSVLIAGRAGGLVSGQHIDGRERHPAQVTLSAMRAAGYTGNFGDFGTGVDEVFG